MTPSTSDASISGMEKTADADPETLRQHGSKLEPAHDRYAFDLRELLERSAM